MSPTYFAFSAPRWSHGSPGPAPAPPLSGDRASLNTYADAAIATAEQDRQRIREPARILLALPFRPRIMDRRVALVPGRYDRIAVVHRSGLLDALLELFDSCWQRGQSLVATAPATPDGPSAQDLLPCRRLSIGVG
ncbi:hypothetical protein ABZV34_33545 [Streptomyces sp. NPDC005195]|uniref:hypothetical protein n=1 Tax=Streptomyces sp. NPDC005195 TaxID=3154561 RepID=UPI0033AA4D97